MQIKIYPLLLQIRKKIDSRFVLDEKSKLPACLCENILGTIFLVEIVITGSLTPWSIALPLYLVSFILKSPKRYIQFRNYCIPCTIVGVERRAASFPFPQRSCLWEIESKGGVSECQHPRIRYSWTNFQRTFCSYFFQ